MGKWQDVVLLMLVGVFLFFLGPVFTIATETRPNIAGSELTEHLMGMNINRWAFSIVVRAPGIGSDTDLTSVSSITIASTCYLSWWGFTIRI